MLATSSADGQLAVWDLAVERDPERSYPSDSPSSAGGDEGGTLASTDTRAACQHCS
ncbi:hypothetical protein COCOBI_09-0320 [Coccomyxa sp. Obi]|nr:hypothetical protein COCOBI_09-0320 [Coccomyxa sp. Obi]